MTQTLRLARLYFVLLAIFSVLRWTQSLVHAEYDKVHHVFSIVILTTAASFLHAALGRRWNGFSLGRAVGLGLVMGLSSQIVVLLSTLASYLLGLDTFFTNPRALNSPVPLALGPAMVVRAGGLVFNTLAAGIIAALGWVFGALLPPRKD